MTLPAPPFAKNDRVIWRGLAGRVTHCSFIGSGGWLCDLDLDSGQHVTARACNVSREKPAADLIPMPRRARAFPHLATLNGVHL